MNIVGFSKIGCEIVEKLSKYPQYTCFYADVGKKGKNCFSFPLSKTSEEAEKNTPIFSNLLEKIEGEVFFFCSGNEVVGGSILAFLEQFKHLKTNIIYVRPNLDLLGEKEKVRERVAYNVLQQYARSGLFEKIVLIDSIKISEILGSLSIIEYQDKINTLIADSFHMLNYLKNSSSIMGNISSQHEINRLSTLGIYDISEGTERYFFDIENVREKHFYFAFHEQALSEEKDLLNKISEQIKKAGQPEFTTVSYDITATTYEKNFAYVEIYTNFIQGEKIVDNGPE